MRRRVEVDERAQPVALPAPVLNELCAHAREALPEECCGLVLGDGAARYGRVYRCRNEMTRLHAADPARYPVDGHAGFWVNPQDLHDAQREADRAGQQVTAVYHSHVDAGAYLSEHDLVYVDNSPEADQIVIAVSEGGVKGVALFAREAVGRAFRGHPVVSEDA